MTEQQIERSNPTEGVVMFRERLVVWGAVGVALVVLVAHQATFWAFTVDDAYITFRYSENLANGFGPVYNPGERVEGYTNFLLMVLLAGLYRLGFDTVLAAKLVGVMCGLAILPVSTALVLQVSRRAVVAASLTPIFLASSPSFASWSVSGLETSLFALLLTLALLLMTREGRSPERLPLSGFVFALAGMTRPEGAVIFIVLFLLRVARWKRSPGVIRRDLIWLATFLSIGVPYFVWRFTYYGYLFPNTFYVKTGRGLQQLLGGILYTAGGVRAHGGVLFFLLAIGCVLVDSLRARTQHLVVVLVFWLVYSVYKGHDVLSMYRFFVPILPLTYGLALIAVGRMIEPFLEGGARRIRTALVTALAFGTIGTNAILSYLSHDRHPELREYQLQLRMDARSKVAVAERLLESGPPDSTIALIDAGAIPYVTGWYTIDRWGLCDETIAHGPPKGTLGERFNEDYVLSKKPTFIQTKLYSEGASLDSGWAGDRELVSHPAFQREYVRLDDPVLRGFFVRREFQAGTLGRIR